MPRHSFPTTFREFVRMFGTDEACKQYLKDSRWPDGFACSRCGSKDVLWKAKRSLFRCRQCRKETSLTAGTVMHRTKIPLYDWFYAAWYVTTHTGGVSALQLSNKTETERYDTVFYMLHKLRAAMVKVERERLRGVVEVDETYIGGHRPGISGRGALGKSVVIGAVEVRQYERDGKTVEVAGRLRLRKISNAQATTLNKFITETIEPKSTIVTDGWKAYDSAIGRPYKHETVNQSKLPPGSEPLLHLHRAFSNLKTWLKGTHHGVSGQHLQAYLNEFAFRFNRRNNPNAAFQTLLGLVDERQGPTYASLAAIEKVKAGIPIPPSVKPWRHPNPERRQL